VHLSLVGSGKPRCDGRIDVHPALHLSVVAPCQRVRVPVVNPATAVVPCAARSGLRAGLIAADAALASGRVTVHDRGLALGAARLGPGRRSAHEAVRLADAGSESPGESWSRLVFAQLRLPRPRLQAEIRDDSGRFVAQVDFLFEEPRIVVEFDGLVQYAGWHGRDALAAEKTREDRLRRLGYVVVRLKWADLRDPARVRTILRDAWRVVAA